MISQRLRLLRCLVGAAVLFCAALSQAQPAGENPPPSDTGRAPGGPDVPQSESSTIESETEKGPLSFGNAAPLTGKIATDRPGFSDSASLVPCGHFQLEGGYQFTYDNENGNRRKDQTLPQAALRVGLLEKLELRANWSGYSFTSIREHATGWSGWKYTRNTHDDGATDFSLGAKTPLLVHTDDNCLPNVSLIGTLSFPTGTKSKSANDVVPELKLPWNYPINECWTVYGSVLGRIQHTDSHFVQTAATLAAAYSVTDWMKLYVEYYGLYHADHDQDCSHTLSGGPIFAITDNISIDTRASVGLNEQAPDFQCSVGMGIRF